MIKVKKRVISRSGGNYNLVAAYNNFTLQGLDNEI